MTSCIKRARVIIARGCKNFSLSLPSFFFIFTLFSSLSKYLENYHAAFLYPSLLDFICILRLSENNPFSNDIIINIIINIFHIKRINSSKLNLFYLRIIFYPRIKESHYIFRIIGKRYSCIDYEDRLTTCRWRNEISRSKSALESHLSIDEEVKDESLPRTRSTADVKRFPRTV